MIKKALQKILRNAIMFICVMAASGCQHQELCLDHTHGADVDVAFDWSEHPDAEPESMVLFLFPLDGSTPLRYDMTGHRGGRIRVRAGQYDAICFNTDTRYICYRNTDRKETFEITTEMASPLAGLSFLGEGAHPIPRASGKEAEPVVMSPEPIWTARAENILIAENNPQGNTLTLTPRTGVSRISVEIRNVDNLKYCYGVSANITSMAGGMLPGINHDELTDENVTIPFDMKISEDRTQISGEFLTLGHCSSSNRAMGDCHGTPHMLTVYAVLSDGSKWYYSYDVTEHLRAAEDQRNINIILDGLPLPKPIVNGGGFHPEVMPWDNIIIPLPM